MNKSILFLLGCILWALCGLGLGDESYSQNALPSGWTGQYYLGDGLGENCYLTLNSNGTFTFKWQGCVGTYDENEGGYSIQGGILFLHPNKPNKQEGFSGTPTEFYCVAWGERKYLVPKGKMIEFCSETNLGIEPRIFSQGSFYFKTGDSKRKASGHPDVPLEFKKYILQKPILGHVTLVLNAQEAMMDKGTEDGLLPGMILVAQDVRGFDDFQVEVLSVNDHNCKIKPKWEDYRFVTGQNVVSKDPNFSIPK